MRLLEFFGQINELRSRVFSRASPDGTVKAFYGSKGASIPTHMFVSSDGSDLKYSDDFYVVSPQPRKLTQFKREIRNKQMYQQEITSSDEAYLTMIDLISNLKITGDMIRKIGKQLPAKIMELNGRPRLFKYMTTDLGFPTSIFTSHFGEAPEMDEGDFTQFHNARLMVPDNMKPASFKAAMEILEAVYQHLDKAGEVDVFGGDIRFAKLPSTTAGEYSITSQDITVNQSLNAANMSGLFTMLHEYAHKKMYELMTPEAVKEVRMKFNELRQGGETHSEDIDYASALMDATSQFKPGQHLTYIGRKKGFKRNPNYIIKSVSPDLYADLARADDPERVVSHYAMVNLLNPKKWKADGIDFSAPQRKPQHEAKTSDWFPSNYSQTNYEEWWAELYPYYILGNLSGEPASWIKGMLHGNTTETVGSNDGEISSDSDPMPPPRRGEEEGNAGWEWTDPYHSSGTENAVLSNTP